MRHSCRGDPDTAYSLATEARSLPTQNSEGAAGFALRAAIWGGDEARMRTASAAVEQGPSTGAVSRAWREAATARDRRSLTAGRRTPSTRSAASIASSTSSGNHSMLPRWPSTQRSSCRRDPTIRRLAEEHRPVLEWVGARPILARLDAALASMPLASPASAAIHVEAPTAGS